MKLPDPNKGSFTPTPAGQHMAICCRFIDLGTQTTVGAYGTKQQRKVALGWEIPALRIKWEKDGQSHEGPTLHMERYTWSMSENANLRKMLESWRGKPFTDEDFHGPKAFDVRNLIGVGAFMQIVHNISNGNTYANLQTIMLPPGGKAAWPQAETQPIYFSLDPDEFDPAAYDGLSDRLRETISQSPEYQALTNPKDAPANRENHDMDDEIPF